MYIALKPVRVPKPSQNTLGHFCEISCQDWLDCSVKENFLAIQD